MKYKEAKAFDGPTRKAKVISNVLSPSKHNVGQVISIVGRAEKNANLFWTNAGALVDQADVEFLDKKAKENASLIASASEILEALAERDNLKATKGEEVDTSAICEEYEFMKRNHW